MNKKIILATLSLLFALNFLSFPAFSQGTDKVTEMNQGIRAYNDNNFVDAAFFFYDVFETTRTLKLKRKAEYYLGRSLVKQGLYQPALYYFSVIFKRGPRRNNPYYFKSIQGLTQVASAVKDDVIIPSLFDKHYNARFSKLPAKILYKINLMVGLLSYRKGKFDEGLDFLSAIPRENENYVNAVYLKGIIYSHPRYAKKNFHKALTMFKEILEITDGKKEEKDKRYNSISTIAMARTYYGMRKYPESVEYYKKVERFSHSWIDALFESSWAYLQMDDYGKALGSIHSVQAPYFRSWYMPESWIVKSTIFILNCLYEETKLSTKALLDEYGPIAENLKVLLEKRARLAFYLKLVIPMEGGESTVSVLPKKIRHHLMRNRRFNNFYNFIMEMEREEKFIDQVGTWQGAKISSEFKRIIDMQRKTMVRVAGQWVLTRLKNIYDSLIDHINQARLLSFETSKAEKNLYLSTIDLEKRLAGIAGRPNIHSQYIYWTFGTEYWLDELGYYEYTLVNACQER